MWCKNFQPLLVAVVFAFVELDGSAAAGEIGESIRCEGMPHDVSYVGSEHYWKRNDDGTFTQSELIVWSYYSEKIYVQINEANGGFRNKIFSSIGESATFIFDETNPPVSITCSRWDGQAITRNQGSGATPGAASRMHSGKVAAAVVIDGELLLYTVGVEAPCSSDEILAAVNGVHAASAENLRQLETSGSRLARDGSVDRAIVQLGQSSAQFLTAAGAACGIDLRREIRRAETIAKFSQRRIAHQQAMEDSWAERSSAATRNRSNAAVSDVLGQIVSALSQGVAAYGQIQSFNKARQTVRQAPQTIRRQTGGSSRPRCRPGDMTCVTSSCPYEGLPVC